MEIFYQHDIALEDDDSLDFEDLLKKVLVIVRCRKFLADLLLDKEIDLAYKHAEPQEKVLATSNNFEPFTYPAQDLTPPTLVHTMQRPVQEVIPVVRIHTSRVKEASSLSLSNNACILVSDLAKDVYENLEALFAEPVDKDLEQPSVGSVGLLKHVEGTRIGTQSFNIKNTRTMRKLKPQAPKNRRYRYRKGAVSRACLFGDRAAKAEGYEKRRSWLIGAYLRPSSIRYQPR